MESLERALSHGLAIATKISYTVFQSAILKALFILDEEHLELAIEQNVDLLPLFMIYAPQWVKTSRDLAGRMGRGMEHKITLENSLKWLRQQCERRKRRYYDIIVNLPQADPGSNPGDRTNGVGSNPAPEIYPPLGADEKRVGWWWGNVQRLTGFVFRGEVPESSKRWGVEHLKWLARQKAEGKTSLNELLDTGMKEAKERKQD